MTEEKKTLEEKIKFCSFSCKHSKGTEFNPACNKLNMVYCEKINNYVEKGARCLYEKW